MKLYIKQLRVNNIMLVDKFNQAKCGPCPILKSSQIQINTTISIC